MNIACYRRDVINSILTDFWLLCLWCFDFFFCSPCIHLHWSWRPPSEPFLFWAENGRKCVFFWLCLFLRCTFEEFVVICWRAFILQRYVFLFKTFMALVAQGRRYKSWIKLFDCLNDPPAWHILHLMGCIAVRAR